MDTSNWRGQLLPETRQLISTKILDKLRSGHRLADGDELIELQKIAQSVEHKSYAGATSKSDYLEKIASKLVLLEKARERDWKNQLSPESRQRIVNKTVEVLRKHVPVSGPEGSQDIWRLAQSIEEKIFTLATSQSDYLRRMSIKMLTLETHSIQRHHGQSSNQFVIGPDDGPTNSVDMNLRDQNSRSRRRPTWTHDYQME